MPFRWGYNQNGQMKSHPFVLIDVFTDTPLAGNPLAVLPQADDLDSEQMQAIAREFNLSETTFVLEPRSPDATRRLRSFSPMAEVFGAGHNALGAWWAIIARGDLPVPEGETTLWQELGERVLAVRAAGAASGLHRIAMTQAPPRVGPDPPSLTALARALSLDVDALEVEGLEPQVISTGANHLLVPIRGLAELSRVRLEASELAALAKPLGCQGCYLFCLETREPSAVAHARGFFPGIGIDEDPATGSAAGPLVRYLVERQRAPQRAWLTIEQGDEIGRPSRIEVRVSGDRVEVAGRCAVVAEGALRL
jgi:PhzF family phenazine biosynthesis protein